MTVGIPLTEFKEVRISSSSHSDIIFYVHVFIFLFSPKGDSSVKVYL